MLSDDFDLQNLEFFSCDTWEVFGDTQMCRDIHFEKHWSTPSNGSIYMENSVGASKQKLLLGVALNDKIIFWVARLTHRPTGSTPTTRAILLLSNFPEKIAGPSHFTWPK
jgi:hypothetical protein